MQPNDEQIAVAAYHRWQRRGYAHGHHADDWIAARKDLTFGLNYRWAARHTLRPAAASPPGTTVLLGPAPDDREGGPRCRFCERSAPATTFAGKPWVVPPLLGNTALVSGDECDDCRRHYENDLAGPFEAFVRPLLAAEPALPSSRSGVPVRALKALVRMGLAVLPAGELHHFEDALEWVTNPDAERDLALLDGLGCRVYVTPENVPSPFASLARRSDDDAAMPYMLFFLGTGRVVLQTHLPFSPRDEQLDDLAPALRGPELSMTMGHGPTLQASRAAFLPVNALPDPHHAVNGSRAGAGLAASH